MAGPEPGSQVPTVLGIGAEDALHALDLLGVLVDVVTEAEADPDDAAARRGLGDQDGSLEVRAGAAVEFDAEGHRSAT